MGKKILNQVNVMIKINQAQVQTVRNWIYYPCTVLNFSTFYEKFQFFLACLKSFLMNLCEVWFCSLKLEFHFLVVGGKFENEQSFNTNFSLFLFRMFSFRWGHGGQTNRLRPLWRWRGHGEVTTPARVSERSGGGVNQRGMLSKASEFICLIFRQTPLSASDQDDGGLPEEEKRETGRKGSERRSPLLQIRLRK